MDQHRLVAAAERVLPLDRDRHVHLARLVIQRDAGHFADADTGAAHGGARADAGRLGEDDRVAMMLLEEGRKSAEGRDQGRQ